MMSGMCKSSDNHFVGVSMYSPHYKAKANPNPLTLTPEPYPAP